MHALVFPDPRLERLAGRFVWLSVDAERSENAGFLEQYPIEAFPSLYVIDPRSKGVLLRWLGSATVPELEKLLDDGARAYQGGAQGPDGLLAQADKLYGDGQRAEAAKVYQQALEQAGEDWPSRPRVVASLLFALWGAKQPEACVEQAKRYVPTLPKVPARANAAGSGLSCALDLPEGAPGRDEARHLMEALAKEEVDRAVASDTGIAPDDISGLFEMLVAAYGEDNDEQKAKGTARAWAAFLEKKAEEAKTPEARAIYDPHRLSAYLEMGEPEKALPMLEASEKALPNDYNPPARLAYVLFQMGRFDEALAANDRALQKVYGPRRLRVLQNRADICLGKGDSGCAQKALEDALRAFDQLPKPQQNATTRQRLEERLAKLKGPSRQKT